MDIFTYSWYSEIAGFEWDPEKDLANQAKHGVSFTEAQLAFEDPGRFITLDAEHSGLETRYHCFGRVKGGIMTVRFTIRDERIRIIGAGYWRKGRAIYEKKKNPLHG